MTASPDPYKAPGIRQWELQDRHAQLCAMLLWLVVATAAQSTCPPAEDSHVIEYLVFGKREIRMSSYRNAWRFMVAYLHMPALHSWVCTQMGRLRIDYKDRDSQTVAPRRCGLSIGYFIRLYLTSLDYCPSFFIGK